MIIEISVLIASLAFVILVIYLVRSLRTLQKSLIQTHEMLSKVNDKIIPISEETLQLLQNGNGLADSIQEQMESFNPLLQTISDVGLFLHAKTEGCGINRFKEKKIKWKETAGDVLELAALVVNLWQELKKRS